MSKRPKSAILQETPWGLDIGGALWPFQPLGWNYLRPLHIHDQTEVLVMRNGTLRLTLGREVFVLRRGQIAWIPPSVEHRVDELSPDVDFWSLQVEPGLLRSVMLPSTGLPSTGLPSTVLPSTVLPSADTSEFEGQDPFAEFARTLPVTPVVEPAERYVDAFLEAADRAWSLYLSKAMGQEPPDPRFGWMPRWDPASARDARDALSTCYRAALSAARSEAAAAPSRCIAQHAFTALLIDPSLSRSELSERLGVSDGYLSRRFPEIFGTSLVAQRARLRLVRFLTLAKTRSVPNLLRTSLQAGFGSYAQLHRVFGDYSVYTPSEYVLGTGRLAAGAVIRQD